MVKILETEWHLISDQLDTEQVKVRYSNMFIIQILTVNTF